MSSPAGLKIPTVGPAFAWAAILAAFDMGWLRWILHGFQLHGGSAPAGGPPKVGDAETALIFENGIRPSDRICSQPVHHFASTTLASNPVRNRMFVGKSARKLRKTQMHTTFVG